MTMAPRSGTFDSNGTLYGRRRVDGVNIIGYFGESIEC